MWLNRLREMKEESGLTTREIAGRSKLPEPTLEKLFAGATKDPKLNTIQQLVHFFGYTLNDLDTQTLPTKSALPRYSEGARKIAEEYDRLDDQWKHIASILFEAVASQATESRKEFGRENGKIIYMPEPIQAASAGTGEFSDDDTCEQVAVLYNKWTTKADYIMRVHGDSMEPQIHDGDRVLVREQPAVDLGETGIFIRNGERYIKVFRGDRLESVNPAYGDVPLEEYSKCVGKVIAVLDPDWIVDR